MSRKKIGIFTLIVAFALCMAFMTASFILVAAEKNVDLSDNSIFVAEGEADVVTPEYESGKTNYLTYRLHDGERDAVSFKKDVALKWYAADGDQPFNGSAEYFSIEFGFDKSAAFTSFTFTLETTQFSMSKEGKSSNEVVFTKSGSSVSASVNGGQSIVVSDTGTIEISLVRDDGYGNYTVAVNGEEADKPFTNIGKYYAKYASSSAATPLTPISFTAEGTGDSGFDFTVQSLNGQKFEINEDNGVTDDTAPVLVIDSEIRLLYLGVEPDFEYRAIDVLASSTPSVTEYYYVDKTGAVRDFGDDGELTGYEELDDKVFFENSFDEGTTFTQNDPGRVSIAFKVSDSNDESAYYFAEWYTGKDFLSVVNPETVEDIPETTFITYNEKADGTVSAVNPDNTKIEAYQNKVSAAAVKDGKSIQVGEGAYYYIPSLKEYVTDDSCGYADMNFTVYYMTETSAVKTVSGSPDELRIELTEEGRYTFRIVPTNSAGNTMTGVFEQKSGTETLYKKAEISSSNVFDAVNLPTFDFIVEYKGPAVEEPKDGSDDVGYVDVVYQVEDFEVIALSGYKTMYELYYFEPNDNTSITVADIRKAEKADGTNSLGTWNKIEVYDNDLDDDEGDNVYSWNPDSSLSFVPQEIGFYKVAIKVSSENLDPVSEFKVIEITSEKDVVRGETQWLQNNITAVVFLVIGVVCLIGIVVLLLIKPQDKAAAAASKARKEELKEKRKSRK